MRNYYREVKEIRKKIVENNDIFVDIEEYLLPGTYISNYTGNILYMIGDNSENNLLTFDDVNGTNIIVKLFVKRNIFAKNTEKYIFPGKYVIISSSRKEYKIFSDKEIITIYSDKNKLSRIINARNIFKRYFHIPTILSVDLEKGICREKIIKHKSFDSNDVMQLFEDYKHYIESTVLLPVLDWNLLLKNMRIKFEISPDLKVLNELPQIFSHGDLWSSNVIFDGSHFFVTDFENSGNNYFLYDFFTLIFTEEFLLDDDTLMKSYFCGELDNVLIGLFNAAGLVFKNDKKKSYLDAFLLIMYNQRWIKAKSFMLDRKISKFINKYKLGEME